MKTNQSKYANRRTTTNSSLSSHFEFESSQDTVFGCSPRTPQIRSAIDTLKRQTGSKQNQKQIYYENEKCNVQQADGNMPMVHIDSFSSREDVKDDRQNQQKKYCWQKYQNYQDIQSNSCQFKQMNGKQKISQKQQIDQKYQITQSYQPITSNLHEKTQKKKQQQLTTISSRIQRKKSIKNKNNILSSQKFSCKLMNKNMKKQKISNKQQGQKRSNISHDVTLGLTFVPFQSQQPLHQGVRRNPIRGTRIHKLRYWLSERVDFAKKGMWVRLDK